jgi:hypothetical protein
MTESRFSRIAELLDINEALNKQIKFNEQVIKDLVKQNKENK